MNIVIMICQVLLCILAVIVVVAVMMQKPRDNASAAAFGQSGGSSYADKMKSHTLEGKLDTITKYGAIAVLVMSFGLVLLQRFAG